MAGATASSPILRRAGVGVLTLLAAVVLVWSFVPVGVAAQEAPILTVGGSKINHEDNYIQVQEGDEGTTATVLVTFTLSSPLGDDTAFEYYFQSAGEPESSFYSTATRGEDFRIGTSRSVCNWHQGFGTMVCRSVIPAGEVQVAEALTVVGDDIDEGESERLEMNLLSDNKGRYRLMATVADAEQNRLSDGRPTYSGLVILIIDDDDDDTAGTNRPTCTCPVPEQAPETMPAGALPDHLEAQQARDGALPRRTPPALEFDKRDVAVRERRGGNSRDLIVRLSENAQVDTVVQYTVHSDGSVAVRLPSDANRRATQGADFRTAGLCEVHAVGICRGSVTIPQGLDRAAIRVMVRDDDQVERREEFKIRLDPGTHYAPSPGERTIRVEIRDND
ncbi:MAG: hypothetical protein OXC06_10675 [Acidimicrobiaceae bacterium]|nr:hypothetical protein [Acidimicrobiaceae bacterium]